jgi:hypothetical protein
VEHGEDADALAVLAVLAAVRVRVGRGSGVSVYAASSSSSFPWSVRGGTTGVILKDYDAVLAGLTWNYSNGPVEAQVHKLKLVKRAMFGRAKLPLLRQRLLQLV